MLDFPAVTMDSNPPANARGTGSIPGLGRFYVLQLSLCATTTEPVLQSQGAATMEPTAREATAMRSPCITTGG